jgi:hypothetical protein
MTKSILKSFDFKINKEIKKISHKVNGIKKNNNCQVNDMIDYNYGYIDGLIKATKTLHEILG